MYFKNLIRAVIASAGFTLLVAPDAWSEVKCSYLGPIAQDGNVETIHDIEIFHMNYFLLSTKGEFTRLTKCEVAAGVYGYLVTMKYPVTPKSTLIPMGIIHEMEKLPLSDPRWQYLLTADNEPNALNRVNMVFKFIAGVIEGNPALKKRMDELSLE